MPDSISQHAAAHQPTANAPRPAAQAMLAIGVLFLAKHKPVYQHTGDGQPHMTLLAVDRQGPRQTEAWTLHLRGDVARAVQERYARSLTPGAACAVAVTGIKAKTIGHSGITNLCADVLSLDVFPHGEPLPDLSGFSARALDAMLHQHQTDTRPQGVAA